jgi:sugar lactone lactonase YvrE
MLMASLRRSSHRSFAHRVFAPVLVCAAALASPNACFGQAAAPYLTTTWAQASPATSPPGRIFATMAYDAANGTVVLFGGAGGGGNLADTWTWNGSTWTQQTPATSPPARYGSAMAYDAANGTVVLFGGYGSGGLADTWTWNGTTWTHQSPSTSPPARWGATMAYDAATGTVLLFGGYGGPGAFLADTWTWNGTTWTQQSPAASPPARQYSTAGYDAATGTVVLFGGGGVSSLLNDTWTWNGSTWTQQSPAASPGARYDAAMAYDAANGTVVLFGGNVGGSLSDTWTWNGTTWTQQSPAASPGARSAAAMAYDAATGAVVLFGGSNSAGTILGDTWNYELTPYFGTVAVGGSASATATFNVTTAGTMGTPIVLTQGAPNLDFTLGTGSTCIGTVAIGNCTVSVNFAPTVPGQRLGAVELTNSSGTVIATAFISGIGSGPLATLTPGIISTVAGNGTGGYVAAQDGGPATSAELYYPADVAVDGAGNLYIADYFNDRVRKVTAGTGIITTVAGNGAGDQGRGTGSYSGDGGPANAAALFEPDGVAVDGAGNLYIADENNQRIRKVTAATGIITTVAGNGTAGYVAAQDGGPATEAELYYPGGVAVDGAGNLYIADAYNNRIRKVAAATGIITTVAGNGTAGYVASQDGGPATSAEVNYPERVKVDGAGNLYIADSSNQRIRAVAAATGIISTVAGNGSYGYVASQDGGPATSAELYQPDGIAVDGAGNLYIADQDNNRIRKVAAATGIISTIGGTGSEGYSATQDGGPATGAYLYNPFAVSLDGSGNLYIADGRNNRIRKVSVKDGIEFPTATAAGAGDSTDGTQTLTLDNIGNLPLTIAAMQNNSGSYILANPLTGGCATTVAVPIGGSCLLGEQFAPVAGSSGLVVGSLAVTDNSLNVSGSVQDVPLSGTTTAGAITVTVSANSVVAGAASDTISVIVGFSGTASDTGAITVTVNGSAAGVGTPSCTSKGGHENCDYPYTGAALATAGNYPIAVSVAPTGSYSAGSGTATLAVTGTGGHTLPVRPVAGPITVAPVLQRNP